MTVPVASWTAIFLKYICRSTLTMITREAGEYSPDLQSLYLMQAAMFLASYPDEEQVFVWRVDVKP